MPTREELEHWDRQAVWHAFTQMAEYEPLLIERGDGCTVYDADGRAYLDAVSSLWCNIHGHRHPRLDAAAREQLDRIAHTTSLGASNSTTIRLAKRLTEVAPAGLNHVFFCGDGAAAIEAALKMAFQYWRQRADPRPEKTLYVALGDAYHGDTIGSVSLGGVERFHSMFAPLLFPVLRAPAPHRRRELADWPADRLAAHFLEPVEQLLCERGGEIAALVVEPLVQCAAGMVVHPPGYLRGLRELTRRHEVLLIADEVAVGFGRTGKLFACEHENVAPDLLCLGKGLTGGYLAMAATLATDEIWSAFLGSFAEGKQFFHGHTYGGNPLAAAVALASLEMFADQRVLERLPEKIDHLAQRLRRLAERRNIGDVRQCGLIAGIDLVKDRATGEAYPWEEKRGLAVCRRAREQGVLLRPLGNVLVVMPPLAITIAELDQIMDAIEAGVEVVCGL